MKRKSKQWWPWPAIHPILRKRESPLTSNKWTTTIKTTIFDIEHPGPCQHASTSDHNTSGLLTSKLCNLKSSQILLFFFRFSPCILFYLMGSVPAIWFLEIDRLERFTDISSSSNITDAQNEALSTINGVNINNLYI